ncbi:MAG: lytic transglycosylase domain-containing protein [Desulfuromonadales bacterium]|nr:lytic transglycosylase domain-containing protein [Desulfuromonadales bacterium]
MSIDLTRLSAFSGILPGQKNAIDNQQQNNHLFEQVLDDTANTLKSIDKSQKQMIEQMRIAQLQLLHGLFTAEDETDDDDFFSGFGNVDSLRQLTIQQGQIVDKYYAPPQPVALKVELQEPRQIAQMIDHVADKVSLSPKLIHSVVAAESDFNPTAVSPAGAQGLMQLMPATAQELGVQDSFDPLQNLLGGSKYLKQLLEKYDGDLDSALAAYNWGQGNVDRHGLEKMPTETRDYLAKIKGMLAA